MILAVDVCYESTVASAAGIQFSLWSSRTPVGVHHIRVQHVSEYVPGEFYRRELPCILALIDEHSLTPRTIIIDGYVYLDGISMPGLGKYLYDALEGEVNIVGVAKSAFSGIDGRYELLRGDSTRPLYVTTAGMPLNRAKECIMVMHGKHRIPTLLKQADQEAKLYSVVQDTATCGEK